MAIVANTHTHVIGVDTHAATHTYALLSAPTGALEATATFPATAAGTRRALSWIGRRTGGDLEAVLVVVEGTGSYGAQVTDAAQQACYRVVEAPPVPKAARRGRGKSDELDAELIAHAALSLPTDRLREPRQGDGTRAALRILLSAREQITTQRTATLNALTALLRTHDLGIDARRPLSASQVTKITAWEPGSGQDLAAATARREATRLARAITAHDRDLKNNTTELTALLKDHPAGPVLLAQPGLGPVNAATILTTWSHPGRIHSEAAFAAIAGVSPLPASSGNTIRHRLNRTGDRRLNRALHTIAVNRMIHDPRTRQYVARKRAEGRTTAEIRRSLKRYIARHLYRLLNNPPLPTAAA